MAHRIHVIFNVIFKLIIIIIALSLVNIQFSFGKTGAVAGQLDKTRSFVANRLVLKLALPTDSIQNGSHSRHTPGIFSKDRHAVDMLLQKYNNEIMGLRFHPATGYYIADTGDKSVQDLTELSQRLRGEPLVINASPDYAAQIARTAPDDTYFLYQYALSNGGQIYHPATGNKGTAGSDIKALNAWDWSTGGDDVTIAVIDTGVAQGHEDLVNKLVPGYNFIDDSFDSQDDNGHGTMVASIAAADTNNGAGIAGVSWNARVMPLKVLDSDGYGSALAVGSAIRYATDEGARVINLSLTFNNPSFIVEDAVEYAYERGVVIVASTGNSARWVAYPAAYDDYVIAVAATNPHDQWWPLSNFGPSVDVAAPGQQIIGAFYSPLEPQNLNSYTWGDGTSFAAPHVAGAAAVLLSYKPFLTNKEVYILIRITADDVNAAEYPGVDDYLGYGRLNLQKLLEPYRLEN